MRALRSATVCATTASLAALLTVAASAPARAGHVCNYNDVSVPESSYGEVGRWLSPGEEVITEGSGTIVFAYYSWGATQMPLYTGADGLFPASPRYPLPGQPAFSVIGRVGDGPWRYIGTGQPGFMNTTDTMQPLQLRVNDRRPGNGSGAFTVRVYDMSCA